MIRENGMLNLRQAVATLISPLTLDFLTWIARAPRTYEEAMEAWRSSCPRLTIWEDALADDLFCVERAGNQRLSECLVALTPRGHALLNEQEITLHTRIEPAPDPRLIT